MLDRQAGSTCNGRHAQRHGRTYKAGGIICPSQQWHKTTWLFPTALPEARLLSACQLGTHPPARQSPKSRPQPPAPQSAPANDPCVRTWHWACTRSRARTWHQCYPAGRQCTRRRQPGRDAAPPCRTRRIHGGLASVTPLCTHLHSHLPIPQRFPSPVGKQIANP
jgi:hypothetical protein